MLFFVNILVTVLDILVRSDLEQVKLTEHKVVSTIFMSAYLEQSIFSTEDIISEGAVISKCTLSLLV